MSIDATDQVDSGTLRRFDQIIDVRSPGEFAEDHLPGAVNLPVLSDAERAEVGTIYVQDSRFKARRIGAAYVARNVAQHLQTAFSDRDGGFQPLIYCWRGGMRSNAMAVILSQVGWRTTLLTGGYRTYRRSVTARLYDAQTSLNLVLLDGHTGSAKTEILGRLMDRGVQTIDLEGLAQHRGSLFGGLGHEQPSQKMFESRLLAALDALDPTRPIVVEAESSKIGERMLPPVLWKAMADAPRIEVTAPRPARAAYLVQAYRDVVENRALLDEAFARLPTYPGRQRLEDWRGLAAAGQFEDIAFALMERHYDPAYDRSSRKDTRPRIGRIEVETLDPAAQDAAAAEVARIVGAHRTTA